MKRFYPFVLAGIGTMLAIALTFVLVRTCAVPRPPRAVAWRRLLGRTVDEVAEALEAVAERVEKEATE
jgi:hypothetical protein